MSRFKFNNSSLINEDSKLISEFSPPKEINIIRSKTRHSTDPSKLTIAQSQFLNRSHFHSHFKSIYETLKKKNNISRTNLLILVNKELTENKKKNLTKINDMSISDAEKEFSAQNNQIINLKTESFSPRFYKGEVSQKNIKNIFKSNSSICSNIKSSPKSKNSVDKDFENSESSLQFDDSFCNSPVRLALNRKTSLSYKKIEFFKMRTLKILTEEEKIYSIDKKFVSNLAIVKENVEYINVDSGFRKNVNTRKRTENGFKYLRTLCNKIKKNKKRLQSPNQQNFELFKEILLMKENVDIDIEDELEKEKIEDESNLNKFITNKMQNNNKNNIKNNTTSFNGNSVPHLVFIPVINENDYKNKNSEKKGLTTNLFFDKSKLNISEYNSTNFKVPMRRIKPKSNTININNEQNFKSNYSSLDHKKLKNEISPEIINFSTNYNSGNNSRLLEIDNQDDFFIRLHECENNNTKSKGSNKLFMRK